MRSLGCIKKRNCIAVTNAYDTAYKALSDYWCRYGKQKKQSC